LKSGAVGGVQFEATRLGACQSTEIIDR
jgi:hypothetical protein